MTRNGQPPKKKQGLYKDMPAERNLIAFRSPRHPSHKPLCHRSLVAKLTPKYAQIPSSTPSESQMPSSGVHIYVDLTRTNTGNNHIIDLTSEPSESTKHRRTTTAHDRIRPTHRKLHESTRNMQRAINGFNTSKGGVRNLRVLSEATQKLQLRIKKMQSDAAVRAALQAKVPYPARVPKMQREPVSIQNLLRKPTSDDSLDDWRVARNLVYKINTKKRNVDITRAQEMLGCNKNMPDDMGEVHADSDYDSRDEAPSTASSSSTEWDTSDSEDSSDSSSSSSSSASSVDEDARIVARCQKALARGKVFDNKRSVNQVQRYKPASVTPADERADKNAFAPPRKIRAPPRKIPRS